MSKRAERRHHQERVRERKRPIVKRWARVDGDWIVKRTIEWLPDGRWRPITLLDNTGPRRRIEYIERNIRLLANHNKCPCKMCKNAKFNRRLDVPPDDEY